MDTRRNRYIESARRFAAADRSDPFAFSRAMTHIDNGICSALGDGMDAIYDATETTETRKLPDGITLSDGSREFQVAAYRNVVRP